MRRAIQFVARLYPRYWRERYGEEFDALIEDHKPGWREFTDVLRGAVQMQMTNAALYLKLAGGLAIAGAIAATVISFRVPRIYESTAVMRITPRQIPESATKETLHDQAATQLNEMEQEILSRTNLESLILQPGLDLYRQERTEEPMEDIVERMRSRYIHIQMVSPQGSAFTVSFAYPNQLKAQAVVQKLTSQFIEKNIEVSQMQAHLWQTIWPQPPPPAPDIEVVDAASAPRKPINASPVLFGMAGLALGLALGSLAFVAMRWPKWTLQVAVFATACCALAFIVSLMFPETYTSSAVLHFTSPVVPASVTGEIAAPPRAERLEHMGELVFSTTSLENIIASPEIDLYKEQREHRPIEDIVRMMRRNIDIRPMNASQSTFRVSFSYPDRFKALAVVRVLVAKFTEENVFDQRERARKSGNAKALEIAEHKVGENLEVLEPPNDPEDADSPTRLQISLCGIGLGALFGVIAIYRKPSVHVSTSPAVP